MFSEVVEAIQSSVEVQTVNVDGMTYTSRPVYIPPSEKPISPLSIATLSGLVQYVKSDPEDIRSEISLFAHVVSHNRVIVGGALPGRRLVDRLSLVEAECGDFTGNVEFGKYISIESLIICLQSQFQPTDDRAAILSILGNLRDERVATYGDDGVTQSVTTRKGIALGEVTPVPRIVKLQPYRTFPEVDQPESDFILRLKQGQRDGEPPSAALFEADGGRWKLQAIEQIAEWLNQNLNNEDEPAGTIAIIA